MNHTTSTIVAILVIVALVILALTLPRDASAASYPANVTPHSCGTRGFDFGRTTVYVNATTSCGLGWSAYRAFRRATIRNHGGYPELIRPKSPVTGRRYPLVWQFGHASAKRGTWLYSGDGDDHRAVQVRFKWKAYR